MERRMIMKVTILLTLCSIVLLCLMILAATVFMPYRGLAKNFPKDVQEALRPRLDEIDKQPKAPRIIGRALIIIMCLMFLAVFGNVCGFDDHRCCIVHGLRHTSPCDMRTC